MRAIVLAAFLLAAHANAQKLASVEGRLLDASTGEPVRKANLVLIQTPSARGGVSMTTPNHTIAASSGAGGEFSFTNLEPGRYMLSAEKPGYIRELYGSRPGHFGPGTNLVLEPGQKLAGLEFRLLPQAVITGKVVDEDGEPMMNTMVSVFRRTPLSRQPTGMIGMSTNDLGEFRIAGLSPGRFVLRAEARGMMSSPAAPPAAGLKGEGTLGYIPTYYPSAADETSAGEILLAVGQQLAGVEVRLRKGRLYQVSGRIQGMPPGGAGLQVNLQPQRTSRGGMAVGFGGGGNVKPDGTFIIPRVQPGSWDAVVIHLESGRPQLWGRAAVTVVDANVDNLVIQANAPLELTGRVLVEGEADTVPTGQIYLVPVRPAPMFLMPAAIQKDRTFKIPGVSRDRFRVDVIGLTGDQYIKSVRYGAADATETGLDLSSAEAGAFVEITLSPKGATVSGFVREGDKPAPAAVVTLLPHPFHPDRRPVLQKVTTADQNGLFTLKGLPPGEYRVYALDSNLPMSDLHDEQRKPFDSLSATVKLKESAREQVELKLSTVPRD